MSDNKNSEEIQPCPICDKICSQNEIETHVNKCIFLNSKTEFEISKRKRSISPSSPSIKPTVTAAKQNNDSYCSPEKKLKPTTYTVESEKNSSDCSVNPIDFKTPLAKQLQPKSLLEFVGQNHVLGKESVLRSLLEKGEVPNMILWGPPGCGKTSLSRVVQELCKQNPQKLKFVSLCAATSGVKEVQNIISAAKMELKFGRQTVLFMDEIHRFNKKQQDVFLLHVEKGDIILIGATTENPSFALNSALLSRCRVIVMEKLETKDLVKILENAARKINMFVADDGFDCNFDELSSNRLRIEKDAIHWLAETSDGDARIALGNLQLVLQHSKNTHKMITVDDIKDSIKKSHLMYDRQGEEHYNIISAMHKSIRGSDANAALYWTSRMILSGEDPRYIARRMVRAASEDIGNADPNALPLAIATMQGCQLIGMPEADVLLAQCAIYLARAPKSREADAALAAAKRTITQWKGPQPSVPMHLRNAPTKLTKDLGYGRLADGADSSFMPAGLEHVNFF